MVVSEHVQKRIGELLSQGKAYSEIATQLSISPSTISKYKRLLKIEVKPNRAGRPRTINARDRRQLVTAILSGRVDTAPEAKRLLALNVSNQTIRNVLRAANLRGRAKVKKPLLTHRHRKRRLDFAYTYRHFTPEDWARVIWSDETKINRMGSDGKRYVWKAPGEGLSKRTVQPTVKHGGGSTMVWGCMTSKGVGRMCVVDGIMDATKYVRILDTNLEATARDQRMLRTGFLFQQDGDPKHTSAKSRDWFEDHRIRLLKWPAQSPDLNPIEHLWDHLKRKLNSYENHPTSIQELEARIEWEWNRVDPEVCRNLVDSMPRRIAAVIRAKGGSTKY